MDLQLAIKSLEEVAYKRGQDEAAEEIARYKNNDRLQMERAIRAEVEVERLRKGIQDYLDGNYDHPRAHRHEPAMGCRHGQHYYEECNACDSAYFSKLLGETVAEETNQKVGIPA